MQALPPPMSLRRKMMPVLGLAGCKVREMFSPLCIAVPLQLMELFRVRCRAGLALAFLGDFFLLDVFFI
jgi:hypothetical protein